MKEHRAANQIGRSVDLRGWITAHETPRIEIPLIEGGYRGTEGGEDISGSSDGKIGNLESAKPHF